MQVKTFRAPTIPQALEQVKRDLGPNAIILGNKKVAVSPNETYVEVMAAVEPESAVAETTSAAPARKSAPAGKGGQIHSDIQEIKSFLSMLISSKDYFAQLQMREPVAEVYHSLLARGLDEKQTYLLLKKAMAMLDEEEPLEKEQITGAFSQQLLKKIRFSKPFHTLPSTRRSAHVFSFLGPTGVGKTTTLAKLAAYLKIKRQMDVGLISADTYRIGAVDQLQTYADILDVPLLVAQSKKEFYHAVDRFRHEDIILVDTIGKNYLNQQYVSDFRGIFETCENAQHLLVLSAAAKDDDMKQMITHFNPLHINSLIFTKIDETLSHGSMINQLLRFQYPVSYFGTGQQVPEDIEPATQKRLLSLLFPPGNDLSGKDQDGSSIGFT